MEKYEKDMLLEQIEHDSHYVSLVDSFLTSKDNIPLDDMIRVARNNGIEIESNPFYEYLSINNIIDGDGLATEEYLKDGYFVVKRIEYVSYGFSTIEDAFTLVTPRGQVWLVEKMREFIKDGNTLKFCEEYGIEEDVNVDIKEFIKMLSKFNINISHKKLYEYLIENNIFDINELPTQDYIDNEYFVIADTKIRYMGMECEIQNNVLITPKGQINLMNEIKDYMDDI